MRYLKVYEYFFDPDDVQIRWGRTKKEIGHTLRNIIVSYKGDDITGQAPKTGLPHEDLGSWNRYGHRVIFKPCVISFLIFIYTKNKRPSNY